MGECPKISSFFKSNTNLQDPTVASESQFEDDSYEIYNCTFSLSKDETTFVNKTTSFD